MLSDFSYVKIPEKSGNIEKDTQNLFCLNNKQKTFEHVKSVALKNIEIAKQYNLDIEKCAICGYLHDMSAVISPADMLSYALKTNQKIYTAEEKIPMLLHQRISKIIAEQDFNITDERILSAVECHSTLKTNPSDYDMALFIADKLSWDKDGTPPFYDVVNDALKKSLAAASFAYMKYMVEHNMILYPHDWFVESMNFLGNGDALGETF